MDTRTQFLLQLLQKLGLPLMQAVGSQPPADASGQRDAQVMAALLTESVKVSIDLSQLMNLKTEDGDADAIRVALASLGARLIGESYRQTGRLPLESDGRRIVKALESVLAFSDNFAPAAEHTQRLQTLEDTAVFFDPVQANLYAIGALTPVIAAVAEFSFGEQDTRLIQLVCDRLHEKSKDLSARFAGSAPTSALTELVVLQALAHLYAAAHRAETNRLKNLAEGAGAASLDPVWQSFDRQVAMVEVLLGAMVGDALSSGRGGGGVKPAVNTPAESAPIEAPVALPPVAAAPPPAAPPSAAQAGGSPMSFFKKK